MFDTSGFQQIKPCRVAVIHLVAEFSNEVDLLRIYLQRSKGDIARVQYACNHLADAAEADDKNRAAGILDRIAAEHRPGKVNIQRFKGLGEMNPLQLRETTMAVETRRLVQLTIDRDDQTDGMMDMLLARKRSADRKEWLEAKGNLAVVQELAQTQAEE